MPTIIQQTRQRKVVERYFFFVVPDETAPAGMTFDHVVINYADEISFRAANERAAKRQALRAYPDKFEALEDVTLVATRDVVVGEETYEVDVEIPDPIKVEVVGEK